jgi:hypothetical protein
MRTSATIISAIVSLAAVGPASAETTTLGLGGWQVQSSAKAAQSGRQISQPGFPTASWLHVRPDGDGAVGTEVGALLQNGACPGVFFSTTMKSCFGYMSQIGPDTIPAFSVPWWFRTTFRLARAQQAQLIINGVVGEAEVWVNGRMAAPRATVQGSFVRYTIPISGLVHPGRNAVALRVLPNNPLKMFTLDNVDWTQIPPDNNTGFQFPIQLHTENALAISGAHVVQHNAPDLSSSTLTVKANVWNYTGKVQTGVVTGTLTPPGLAAIRVGRSITLAPRGAQTVSFPLVIHHPRVWWPYQMGAQPLYRLSMAVSQGGGQVDSEAETFGIRTITSRLIGASPIAPHGSRQFLVNGRPVLFRAGGWSEDLFLRYSPADTANQIALIKNLGLNGIRTEGKQMPDDFYEQMDRAGILIDAGFQCCDAWQLADNGKGVSFRDYQVLGASALSIGAQLRNHPSVMNFSWSDNAPTPRQEAVSLRGFRGADFQEPLIASAEYKSTARLGPSGEKEGPYDWVPPGYWYDTTHFDPKDPTRTNVGGAWAFNSEASAGHTVPTLDSISRFMSPLEQAQLWQNPDYNQYHANYEPDLPGPSNSGYSFGTLHDLDTAISNRYGAWTGLAQYVQEAQVQNYETQRAEFEAYIAHSKRRSAPSTGLVYWQLNKGWPTLLWALYNHDSDQAGSYFGAKKANEAVHVSYAYESGTVTVDNLTGARESGLSVDSRVYDVGGNLLDRRTVDRLSVGGQGVIEGVLHPRVPASTAPPAPAKTYFVELLLRRGGRLVDRNVYWLSTQRDIIDWPKTMGNPHATMAQFGDLTQLHGLPSAALGVRARTRRVAGRAITDVTVTNTSKTRTVAFFLRADVRRGTAQGTLVPGDNQVLPIFWNDNDITLWPGESQTLRASYRVSDLRGRRPAVTVSGWNESPMFAGG